MREGLDGAIPFNKHIGLRVEEVGPGRGVVTLPDKAHLQNHVGSQHAGGLFAAGEAASGGAFMGAFVEHLGSITPLAKGASIDYRKLAKGPVTAVGTLSEDVNSLVSTLESEGKVQFPICVEMTVQWHVRKNG